MGSLGCSGHQLALISQDSYSPWPALSEVGHFEMFAYDRGRAGPRRVNEEGRLEQDEAGPTWGDGRACTDEALHMYRVRWACCRPKSWGICPVAL